MSLAVVDRDHDAIAHHPFRAETEAKGLDGFFAESALGEVRVIDFEMLELEAQGLVLGDRLVLGLRLWLIGFAAIDLCWSLTPFLWSWFVKSLEGFFQVKPFSDQPCGLSNADVFHLRYEVEDVASGFTTAEAIPAVFRDADAEGGWVFAFVNRAAASQLIIIGLTQVLQQTVMLKDLSDGHTVFNDLEVHVGSRAISGHGIPFDWVQIE